MRAEDDALVAELLLKRGWLDTARLRRAVEICEAARTIDLAQDLQQVLVQKGFLGEREARALEAELGLDHLTRPESSQAIAGYRLWNRIEPWGLGAVFRGIQLSMERAVALKVLAPMAARDPDFLERFVSEGRAAGQVDHPNVVGALDMGRSGDYYYYATELLEGQTLLEALRGGPLPVARALQMARQMAQALAHVQELGLVHGDVQPASILLPPEGPARLCNLGGTRRPNDPSIARTGIPVGTLGYSAPELLGPTPRGDIRSDIYSLGATLYHALTGHRPGRADAGPILPPAMIRPELPKSVSDLVCRMTAPDPAARFQDPAELLLAMEEMQDGLLLAPPPNVEQIAQQVAPDAVAAAAAFAPTPAIAPVVVPPKEVPQPPAEAEPPSIAVPPETPAAGPAGRSRRRLVQAVWAAAFGFLATIFLAASAWALWTRFGHRGARSPRPGAERSLGEKAKGEPREPSKGTRPVPPTPPPPEPELGEGDLRLVEDALAFDRNEPERHAEAVLRLRRALLVAGDSRLATRLRARLAIRQQMFSAQANDAYGELNDRLTLLRSQGRYGAALQACNAFPESLRYGSWADLAAARFAELGEDAERQYLGLALKGAAALQDQKPDDGEASYRAIAGIGIPWMTRAAEPLVAAAAAVAAEQRVRLKEAAARRAVLDRRRALGALAKPFALVYEEVKKRDYAKALEVCKALPEKLREGECGKAVASLEGRLGLLADLWEAILKGPVAALGKSFALHGTDWVIETFVGSGLNAQIVLRTRTEAGDRTLRQPIWRLPGLQVGMLGEWATERAPAGIAAVKVGLLYLTEGEAARARQKLLDAQKAGEDVASCVEELDADAAVPAALTAYRQGQWAEARKLIEGALDRLGTTSAVILSHRALSNALADCLLKLGEGASAQPPPPALPERLQWLVLLPETQLSPLPPANPLDAHFAAPLRRSSPQRLGLDAWRDYAVSVRWTSEAPARVVLAARVGDAQPGVFQYYFVAVGNGQLVLGRRDSAADAILASKPYPARSGSAKHHLTFTLVGSSLSAETENGTTVEATDASFGAGRVVLAAPDAPVLVQELLVNLRPPKHAAPKGKEP